MGKNVPLRIGRKSKRELNPVEKMRRKEKHKKNVKQFMKKITQKANGEFKSKVKVRRSPSPESNDPMIGELISVSRLRNTEAMKVYKNEGFNESELEKSTFDEKIEKNDEKKVIVPVALSKKQEFARNDSSWSESDDEDEEKVKVVVQKIDAKPRQNQAVFKAMIESDSKLTDFFNSVRDFM
jgi:hypothetical protein